jgi:hypothetical protein
MTHALPAAELTLPDTRQVNLAADPDPRGVRFRFAQTRLPGSYLLRTGSRDESLSTARFHVRRHPGESALAAFTASDRAFFSGTPQIQVGGGLKDAAASGPAPPTRHPLEGWLLTLLAVVLVGEMLLAAWSTGIRTGHCARAT